MPSEKVYFVLEYLWRERGFDMLVELTAVDYLEYPEGDGSVRRGVCAARTRRPASG